MKKHRYIPIILLFFVFFNGCSKDTFNAPINLIDNISHSSCYVYNVNDENVDCYNKKNQHIYSYIVNTDSPYQNTFFYTSKQIGKYYSVGDSIEGDFCLICLNNNDYQILYREIDKKKSFFPIAQTSDLVFLSVENEYSDTIKGSLAMWNEKSGFQYIDLETDDVIICGSICDNKLYYTTYQKYNLYYLYELDYTNSLSKPTLVNDSLIYPEIYAYNGNIYYYTNSKITIGNVTLQHNPNIYIFNDYILNFYNNKNSIQICTIYDVENGNVIKEISNAIGYSFSDNTIYTYSLDNKREVLR